MTEDSEHTRVHVDRDGVRTTTSRRTARWLIATAIGLPIVVTALVIAFIRLAPAGARATIGSPIAVAISHRAVRRDVVVRTPSRST